MFREYNTNNKAMESVICQDRNLLKWLKFLPLSLQVLKRIKKTEAGNNCRNENTGKAQLIATK